MAAKCCSSKPTESIIPGTRYKVNSGPWIIMMHQCSFTHCKKCTTVVGDVDSQGACKCRVWGRTREHTLLFAWSCCEPKIALKIKCI